MKSVWEDVILPSFPALRGDEKTDVLVVGGGMAGILTAWMLKQQGVDCIVAEQNTIGSGTTRGTTAKLTVQHGLIYHRLLKAGGIERAQMYYEANRWALDQFAALCTGQSADGAVADGATADSAVADRKGADRTAAYSVAADSAAADSAVADSAVADNSIDCGFEVRDNYIYAKEDPRLLQAELTALRRIGVRADLCRDLPIPVKTVGAVRMVAQAQFHPLQFLAALARGLTVYEHTGVREMVKPSGGALTAVTDHGRIRAGAVVCATHFPFINKHGSYYLKLYQSRSYMAAFEGAPDVGGMYDDEAADGLTFRTYRDTLIVGGSGGRTGKESTGWILPRAAAGLYAPGAREVCFWAAQDCMSLDGIPYIGRYSARTPDFFVATGFNKWGMTGSMVAARLLTDAILRRPNDWAPLFDPSRSILKAQLLRNGAEAIRSLCTVTPRRCPHLGCALHWNSAEHSWDCPCHGSRFAQDGTVLDGPAQGDLPPKAEKTGNG